MNNERNEWIKKYLKGKEVTVKDLTDFFLIESKQSAVEVRTKKDQENIFIIKTKHYIYTIETINKDGKKTLAIITNVDYELNYNQEEDNNETN